MKNLKIRPGYKTLALFFGMLFVSCRHENVILEKGSTGMRVKDIKTGVERIYTTGLSNDLHAVRIRNNIMPYFMVGDTVRFASPAYDKHAVLTPTNADLYFDRKTLTKRYEDTLWAKQFEYEWQKLCHERDEKSK